MPFGINFGSGLRNLPITSHDGVKTEPRKIRPLQTLKQMGSKLHKSITELKNQSSQGFFNDFNKLINYANYDLDRHQAEQSSEQNKWENNLTKIELATHQAFSGQRAIESSQSSGNNWSEKKLIRFGRFVKTWLSSKNNTLQGQPAKGGSSAFLKKWGRQNAPASDLIRAHHSSQSLTSAPIYLEEASNFEVETSAISIGPKEQKQPVSENSQASSQPLFPNAATREHLLRTSQPNQALAIDDASKKPTFSKRLDTLATVLSNNRALPEAFSGQVDRLKARLAQLKIDWKNYTTQKPASALKKNLILRQLKLINTNISHLELAVNSALTAQRLADQAKDNQSRFQKLENALRKGQISINQSRLKPK